MERDLLKEYFFMFGEKPQLLQCMSYENPLYQDLLAKAIERKKPITDEELDILDYDLVLEQPKSFKKFGKK